MLLTVGVAPVSDHSLFGYWWVRVPEPSLSSFLRKPSALHPWPKNGRAGPKGLMFPTDGKGDRESTQQGRVSLVSLWCGLETLDLKRALSSTAPFCALRIGMSWVKLQQQQRGWWGLDRNRPWMTDDGFDFWLSLFCFRQSHCVALAAQNSICTPGWPQTYRSPWLLPPECYATTWLFVFYEISSHTAQAVLLRII